MIEIIIIVSIDLIHFVDVTYFKIIDMSNSKIIYFSIVYKIEEFNWLLSNFFRIKRNKTV